MMKNKIDAFDMYTKEELQEIIDTAHQSLSLLESQGIQEDNFDEQFMLTRLSYFNRTRDLREIAECLRMDGSPITPIEMIYVRLYRVYENLRYKFGTWMSNHVKS